MKIVHVLLSPRIGGAEVLVFALDEGLQAKGFDSKIVYLDDTFEKQSRLKRAVELRRKLKSLDSDVILAHSFLPGLYARMVAPRKSSVHYVLHSASDDYSGLASRLIERLLLHRTHSVIAVSLSQLNVYLRHFKRPIRTIVINNGVSDKFTPFGNAKEHPSPFKIVTIARVAVQKRPEFWLQVARLAHEQKMDFRFEWWGPLSGNTEIDNLVLCHLPPNAFFMGPTKAPEEILKVSHLVFNTSDREAFSLSILEAAVVGRPQIYSNSLELSEVLSSNLHAYTSDIAESAFEKLKLLSENWSAYSQKALEYADEAAESFSMSEVTSKYSDWISSERT